MTRRKPEPSPRTLAQIADDIDACENTLAGLRKEHHSRKAALEAQRDAIALELAVVASPTRLTDVAETDIQDAPMRRSRPMAEPDLTIPAFMRRA
jgi:hypothetical protein